MHNFKRYYELKGSDKKETQQLKKKFLSKYYRWVQEIFVNLETLINTIDGDNEVLLSTAEVTYFGKVLTEMYAHEPETELESMLVALTKLTKLHVRICRRLNKAL